MTPRRLDNYLLTCRKAAGFSQDEVAFLLGGVSGTKVSRYERRTRVPQLDTALAYEAVFGTPVRELFAGRFQRVEGKIGRRVQLLVRKLEGGKHDRPTGRKLEKLRAIASGTAPRPVRRI
jgi:transcriptional regulator with XRE-family HTH domain